MVDRAAILLAGSVLLATIFFRSKSQQNFILQLLYKPTKKYNFMRKIVNKAQKGAANDAKVSI